MNAESIPPNRSDRPRALLRERPQAVVPARAATVLLVDDDVIIRSVAAEMLTMLGYGVIVVKSGTEALEQYRLQRDRIQVVLLDLHMPGMGGEEAFRELAKMNKDVQVIISSGFSEGEVAEKFAGTGVVGFIQKPYLFSDFSQKFEKVTGERQTGNLCQGACFP